MPIYEYQCNKCGEVFEVFQKLNDPPPKSHSCGSRKVHRVISRSSFILKGTGWYVTDYGRKDQGGNRSGGNGKEKKKTEDTGSGSGSNSSKTEATGTSTKTEATGTPAKVA